MSVGEGKGGLPSREREVKEKAFCCFTPKNRKKNEKKAFFSSPKTRNFLRGEMVWDRHPPPPASLHSRLYAMRPFCSHVV